LERGGVRRGEVDEVPLLELRSVEAELCLLILPLVWTSVRVDEERRAARSARPLFCSTAFVAVSVTVVIAVVWVRRALVLASVSVSAADILRFFFAEPSSSVWLSRSWKISLSLRFAPAIILLAVFGLAGSLGFGPRKPRQVAVPQRQIWMFL